MSRGDGYIVGGEGVGGGGLMGVEYAERIAVRSSGSGGSGGSGSGGSSGRGGRGGRGGGHDGGGGRQRPVPRHLSGDGVMIVFLSAAGILVGRPTFGKGVGGRKGRSGGGHDGPRRSSRSRSRSRSGSVIVRRHQSPRILGRRHGSDGLAGDGSGGSGFHLGDGSGTQRRLIAVRAAGTQRQGREEIVERIGGGHGCETLTSN
mmetsp:Transcript_4902/g.13954  ORF Transcript_4902/g.13954 Transcript_4902/m.13954 type:complete len:203 (+) Transcript_4902:1401-2009(+)